MFKLIALIFIIVFSVIRLVTKNVKAAEKAKMRQKDASRFNSVPPMPDDENFDQEFRFLYDEEYEIKNENETNNKEKISEVVSALQHNAPVRHAEVDEKTNIHENDAINEECDIERWRRAIIDTEILKTKF